MKIFDSNRVKYLANYIRLMLWPSVSLGNRGRLPSEPGLYAVVSLGRVLYIGKSINIRTRWTAKGAKQHHRLPQAEDLVFPRLKYLVLAEEEISSAEKYWIYAMGKKPPWNYSSIPPKWEIGELIGLGVMALAVVVLWGQFNDQVIYFLANHGPFGEVFGKFGE